MRASELSIVIATLLALALPLQVAAETGVAPAPAAAPSLDRDLAVRILALDCNRLSASDVHDTLAFAPAPRLVVISGSFDLVTMDSFSRFLAAMGLPAERIRNPADGAWAYPSATPSTALAGILAWHYEHDGMMPVLIGYSGGGMLAVRTLHELAGAFGESIAVVDPRTGDTLSRDAIIDPIDGRRRPVLGLTVPYAAAIATGKLPRFVLGQWTMLDKLRSVPDTVEEFTGFTLEWDPIAGTFPGSELYAATGSANVRNVALPASYRHLDLPRTEHLAADAATRAWIEAYASGTPLPVTDAAVDTSNLLHASDIWHSVKKHWCLAGKRVARAGLAR